MNETKRNPNRAAPGVEKSISAQRVVALMSEERARSEDAVIDPALRAESVRLRDKAARGEPLAEEEVRVLWHMVRKVKSLLGGESDGMGIEELNSLMECDRVLDQTVEKETILLGLNPAELMAEVRRGDSPAWHRFTMAAGLRSMTHSPARAGDDKAERVAEKGETYTPAQVRKMTGFSPNTVNKYARLAGVRRPRRGERNFRYTLVEVQKILETIVSNGGASTVDRETAQTALRHIGQYRS